MSCKPRPLFLWHQNPSTDNRLNSLIWADSLMKQLIPRQWKRRFFCLFFCYMSLLTFYITHHYITALVCSFRALDPTWKMWFSDFRLPYGSSGPNLILLTNQCQCRWPYFPPIPINYYHKAALCHRETSSRIRTVLMQTQEHHPQLSV